MMRSTFGSVFSSRAILACAAAPVVWIALMLMASSAQASPGDTELVSISSMTGAAAQGRSFASGDRCVSTNGRYVLFDSDASDLVTGPWNGRQVYLRDRGAGSTERISVTPSGLPGNGDSAHASISANDRYVAFASSASDLVAGDTNGVTDVFVRDRQTGSTERVNIDSNRIQATGGVSSLPSISADGRYVAFVSSASNLVAGDTDASADVFVRDRELAITTRVSIDTDGNPISIPYGPLDDRFAPISADGRYVAFTGWLSQGYTGVFLHDRQAGTTELVDTRPYNISLAPSISADGSYVAFEWWAETTPYNDILVRDRVAGTTERVSVSSTGIRANDTVWHPSISADGRYVAFYSWASTLVVADNNGKGDIFVHDRQLRTTVLASVSSRGLQANGWSADPALSADGRFVAFDSWASNLVANDHNADADVFIHELGGPPPSTFEFAVKPTALAFGNQALFTSATLSVWVTNKGTAPLPVTSVELDGTNPGMFSVNNRCGSSVAVGASCSVRVTFRPTSVGDKSAKLRVVAGDGDVRTKALAGTGVVSPFTVSPTSLDFGSVPIGTTTAPKVVTIRNSGSAALSISSITLAGWNPYQFAQTHDCPANLAVGASCTISVVFKPTGPVGSKAALLNITPEGGAATRSVALAGAARR